MFTEVTYQDWERTPESMRGKVIMDVISRYKGCSEFQRGLEANAYFTGKNTQVSRKTLLKADVVSKVQPDGRTRKFAGHKEVVGNRLANGLFNRFVVQQNQYLMSYGVTLDDGVHEHLGPEFDHTMQRMGELALLHGVSWGFWNVDHLEAIEAVRDRLSGFVALLDEFTGLPRVGIQFWQLDERRPICIRLFEEDGVTMFRFGKGGLQIYQNKRPYKVTILQDAIGTDVVCESNYGALPVIPLYANNSKESELTDGLKAKIDAYDNIMSDLADNLDRANDVYWVLNNFGGSTDDVLTMLDYIQRVKAVVSQTDGMGGSASAEPHTIEVPYQARQTALDLLKKAMYQDYMALDMDELTGGNLTNVAIKVAMTNLNLKADKYEWQASRFVRGVLNLCGLQSDTIRFKRSQITNEMETVQAISLMRQDIDLRTALELNPYISDDMIDTIIQNVDAEGATGLAGLDELQAMLDKQRADQAGDDA